MRRACLILAVALGCGGAQHATAPPSTVVIDPGAAPRQVLRFEPVLHAPSPVQITLKVRTRDAFTNTTLETGHRDTDLPSLQLTGTVEAIARDAAATTVRLRIARAELLDDVTDLAVRERLAPLVITFNGREMTWRLAPDGSFAMDGSADERSEEQLQLSRLREAIGDTVATFPAAAIGVGASWRVTSRTRASGVTWDRTTTYTLRALTGDQATLEISTAARAGSQALQAEPNATTRLTSGSTSSHGETTLALHGIAQTAHQQATTELKLLIVRGHLRISSVFTADTIVTIERKIEHY